MSESSEEEILVNGVKEVKKYLLPQSTFAVRARREGEHAYSSMEIAAKLGSNILDSDIPGLRVDLTNPDSEIFLDIRGNLAHYFKRFCIKFTKQDRTNFAMEVFKKLVTVEKIHKFSSKIYPVQSSCSGKFYCSYIDICASGSVDSNKHYIREKVSPELKI